MRYLAVLALLFIGASCTATEERVKLLTDTAVAKDTHFARLAAKARAFGQEAVAAGMSAAAAQVWEDEIREEEEPYGQLARVQYTALAEMVGEAYELVLARAEATTLTILAALEEEE